MALRVLSMLHSSSNVRNCCGLTKRLYASSSKDIAQVDHAALSIPKRGKDIFLSKEQKSALEAKNAATVIASEVEDVGVCSGVPDEEIKSRTVRIYCPAKNAMQSGTNNINYWQLEFDTRERWENPLMGWTSTGDPLSNLQVEFATKDEAIAYCDKMGWKYYIQTPNINNAKPRSYGNNFSWNKRTRVSTK